MRPLNVGTFSPLYVMHYVIRSPHLHIGFIVLSAMLFIYMTTLRL